MSSLVGKRQLATPLLCHTVGARGAVFRVSEASGAALLRQRRPSA